MDLVSGVGIAAAVIQFVDFGSKVVARSSEYYRSATDLSIGHSELERVTQDLVLLCANLDKPLDASNEILDITSNHEQLRTLDQECPNVADSTEVRDKIDTNYVVHVQDRFPKLALPLKRFLRSSGELTSHQPLETLGKRLRGKLDGEENKKRRARLLL